MIRQLVFLIELFTVLFSVAQGIRFLLKAFKALVTTGAFETGLYLFRALLWMAFGGLLAYAFENILK